MSAHPTGQPGDARRLLGWMFVGPPPKKPPGGVDMTLVVLGFVANCFITAFAFFVLWLSVIFGRLGNLASYHRWRGDRPGELLRLGSGLSGGGFLVVLLAHFALTGQWGWLWWAVFVLALTTVVLVAGRFYGQDDGLSPEDGSPAGRSPSNQAIHRGAWKMLSLPPRADLPR